MQHIGINFRSYLRPSQLLLSVLNADRQYVRAEDHEGADHPAREDGWCTRSPSPKHHRRRDPRQGRRSRAEPNRLEVYVPLPRDIATFTL